MMPISATREQCRLALVETEMELRKAINTIALEVPDEVWRFTGPGSFPSAEEIHRARPWNKP